MNLEEHLLRLAGRNKLALGITIGLGVTGGILTVCLAFFLSRTISLVFLGESTGLGKWDFLEQVPALMALILGVILARAVLIWGSELSANSLAIRVKQELRSALYMRIQALGPSFASGERTGELAGTAMEGVEALDAYFSQYLPQLALAALVPVTILLFVFPLDWLSGLVLLLTAPLIPIFMILIGSVAQNLTRRQWQTLSRMSAYFLDVIQGLTTLKILGRSRAQLQVIEQVNDRFRQTTMSVLRVTFLSALVLELVATLSTAVVAVEVGLRLLYGRLVFEQALFVLILAPEFYLPLRMLGARFHAGMAGVAAANRIFEILDEPPPGDGPDLAQRPGPAQPGLEELGQSGVGGLASTIHLDSVTYAYPGERPVLQEVTFQIQPGQKVALVGPSGAGKSTIAGLLMGFLQPQQGIIRVGDRSLTDIPAVEWRSQVSWVPQNPYLFEGTLAENLRLARPGATQEEMEQAAGQANLHEFIQDLPDGYETRVGERGIGLSGGQARRLALARAFLKDAPLLILDEATANLDPEQEALIQESLQRLVSQRTVLVIAHRLNTVRQADLILVLDQGKVVEVGTHEALLQQDGLYRQMIEVLPDPAGKSVMTRIEPGGLRQAQQEISHAQQDWASTALAAALPGNEPAITAPLTSAEVPGGVPASHWKNLRRLLHLAAPYTGWVSLSVLTGFAAIACGIGLMATSAYILSAAALKPSIAELQVAIVGVRFFGIGRGVFRYLERNLSHEVTFRLLGHLRRSFYQALEPLAPARLLQLHSGDLLARIHSDIAALENFYVRVLAPPLVAVLVALLVALWLGSFSPLLALALAGAWILVGIGLPLMIHILGRKPSRECVLDRARLNTALVDSVQGMADLAIFDQAGQYAQRFLSLNQHLIDGQKRVARLGAAQTALNGAIAHLGMWSVLLLAIPMVLIGQIDGVYLATLVLAALASFEAFSALPQAAQYLESSLQSAQRLYEIVDAEPAIHEPASPLPIPERLELNLQKVSFAYPASKSAGHSQERVPLPALSELSFRLAPGERLAIVGPSGAGKSTLTGLLLRFWELRSGEIRLRGERGVQDYLAEETDQPDEGAGWQEISSYNSYDLRRHIGVLSQNTYLFAASLRDNLRLARPKATQAEIERAAQQAQLQPWIESLPERYDTWIGEQGLRLSAGERQRVAIARLLLQDAPVFILDEPTANLDALNERLILQELLSVGAGRSMLLITHRLAGLEDFDEILVLHQGRVVQRGTLAALLGQPGYFRRMWELQNGVL